MTDVSTEATAPKENPALTIGAVHAEDAIARVLAGDLTRLAAVPDYLLDYIVALEEGFEARPWPEAGEHYWQLYLDSCPVAYIGSFDIRNLVRVQGLEHYSPSRNPVYSTEIIIRERIGTRFDVLSRQWVASECAAVRGLPMSAAGPTPSIAALRCYVATRAQQKVAQNLKK